MFRFSSAMATSPRLLHLLLLFYLCSSSCMTAAAQTTTKPTDTLKQGESLSGSSTLVSSPEAVFELGFFAPDPQRPSRQYLGIWYHGIAPRTVVWVANRVAPATSALPSLALMAAGELRVLDGTTDNGTADAPLLWSSNTSSRAAPRGGYAAVLQDSGNLEVRSEDGAFWDSFSHPTDTILSGMRITLQTPGRGPKERMLFTSWASETDPSPGRYALGLDPNNSGQAYIWKDGNVTYWRSASCFSPCFPAYKEKHIFLPFFTDYLGS